MGPRKKRLFVASSGNALDVARAIHSNLSHDVGITTWDCTTFQPSDATIEALEHTVDKFDFGVFVFNNDDRILEDNKEEKVLYVARDNVVLECGLFMGRLGRGRVFIVCPDIQTLHLPSDLAGVTVLRYDPNTSKADLRNALEPACNTIRVKIGDVGTPLASRVFRMVLMANMDQDFNKELLASLHCHVNESPALPVVRVRELHDRGGAHFVPTIRSAVSDRPEFLVIVPPGKQESNLEETKAILNSARKDGRYVIFINNPPDEIHNQDDEDSVIVVQADMPFLAGKLIDHCIDVCKQYSYGFVLLVHGPHYNEAAQQRASVFEKRLKEEGIDFKPIKNEIGWEEKTGYDLVAYDLKYDLVAHDLKGRKLPDLIVCGNDTMAFGAIRAIMDSRQVHPRKRLPLVVGFDGLAKAICQIDDPWNPFYATMKVSPTSYGETVSYLIGEILQGNPVHKVNYIRGESALQKKPSPRVVRG